MNNYNNNQDQIDVTQSFTAFADIANLADRDENPQKTPFEVKQYAAFGQFVPESAAFPA